MFNGPHCLVNQEPRENIDDADRAERMPLLGRKRNTWAAMPSASMSFNIEEAPQRRLRRQNGDSILVERKGLRVSYDDYTTIDWVHDRVKERVRVRSLRSGNWLEKQYDGVQAWILVMIIGIFSGLVACAVYVGQILLTDLKEGRCKRNIFLSKLQCCLSMNSSIEKCDEYWESWAMSIGASDKDAEEFSFTVYVAASVCLAVVASAVTSLSRRTMEPSGDDAKIIKRRYTAAGSGIPELKTILSGFVIRGFLGLRTLVTKTVALTLAIASGLCIGQQGPLVHISTCVGNVASRFFSKYAQNEAKRREMMSAASAAGVSVAFGAPIGGVLYSLEEVSYYFPSKTMWRSFVCALAAAVTVKIVNPFGTGKLVSFEVGYKHNWYSFEIFPFMVLGVFGGCYGAIYIASVKMWFGVREIWSGVVHPVIEVAFVAILTSLVSFRSYYTRIGVNELLAVLLSECPSDDEDPSGLCESSMIDEIIMTLLSTLLLKAGLNLITSRLRIPSGVLSPAMAVGACAGRIFALLLIKLVTAFGKPSFIHCVPGKDCIIPGVYAMVGAASAVSGITRLTVALVVTMVERTGSLTYVIPIMISIMISKWTADRLSSQSIYEFLIENQGYPYLDSKRQHHHELGATGRAPATARDVAHLDLTETFQLDEIYDRQDIIHLLSLKRRELRDGGFPVLSGNILVGYIGYGELEHACESGPWNTITFGRLRVTGSQSHFSVGFFNKDLTPWIDTTPLVVNVETSMELVTDLFIKLGLKTLCVIKADGTFRGVIHKKTLLAWLKRSN